MHAVAIDNLPIPLPATVLVGREQELARLITLLSRPDVRLVTLLGPGGVGKTRLAFQIAREIDQDIVGPVRMALLANITDSAGIIPAIARALSSIRLDDIATEDDLAGAIGNQPLLLILDNTEQVTDHLTFLSDLLVRCPNLTILVTSRIILHLSVEHVVTLDPLPTTSAGHDQLAPATALFVDRARLVQPDLKLTDENIRAIDAICQKVDGLPLAIELAAARTRFFSPIALRDRLSERLAILVGGPRDAPERHRTLRATLTWSYDLLSPDERILFRRLGVAVNGIPFDAVDPICNSTGDLDHRVPERLEALIDHSLVRIDNHLDTGPRVRMLLTVREFAQEQLELSGESDVVQRAHAMWYANMVINTPITTWGTGRPELREWTLRHQPDLQTFSTVLTRLEAWGEHATALKMTGQLISFWSEIGHYREALKWTRALIPYAEELPIEDRAHIFFKAALILHMADEIDETQELARRSLALYEQLGEARWIANIQNMLANLQWQVGNDEEGERYHRMAIATSASSGNMIGVAMFKPQLADRLVERGRFAEAEQLLDEAFPVIEKERPDATPLVLGSKALLYLKTDRLDLAGAAMRKALEYYEAPPHRRPDLLAEILMFTADLAARRDLSEDGTLLLGMAEKIIDEIGMEKHNEYAADEDRIRSALREQAGPEKFDQLLQQGQLMPIPSVIELAMSVCERVSDAPPAPAAPQPDADGDLTPREMDVLRLLVAGKSNAEIADELFISQRTVTTHLTRLYAKLEVTSRTAAISTAIRMGIAAPS